MLHHAACMVVPHPKWHMGSPASLLGSALELQRATCTTGMIKRMWLLPIWGQTRQDSLEKEMTMGEIHSDRGP